MIVGLVGKAGAGKDTVGRYMRPMGWRRVAFGDLLKDALYALDPTVSLGGAQVSTRALVDAIGWDQAKVHPEVRGLLQRLGTEAGRGVLGESVWVDALMRQIHDREPTVVTDVRFPNEVQAIRGRGGVIVLVRRVGLEAGEGWRAHASEALADAVDLAPDMTVLNNPDVMSRQEFGIAAARRVGKFADERAAAGA